MMRRIWQEELDSHVLDYADDLMKLGYDQSAALAEAKKQLGDLDQVAKELATVHPWLAVYADWLVLILLLLGIIPLYALHYLAASTLLGLVSDHLLLWWWGGGLALLTLLLLKWQWSIIPLTNRLSLGVAFSLGWFVAACITIALDVNNFETIIYNGLFGLSCGLFLMVLWKPLTVAYRQWFILAAVTLMIIFAWREEGLLETNLFQQCLYLVDNNPLLAPSPLCRQVSPVSGYFVFIYTLAVLVISYLIYYLRRLWQDGIYFYRKWITTATLICLPLVSVSISGVNSTGALDVVAWKVDIYTAYVDILGRRPETKDYQFYATTRSYQHMSEVREVLYHSEERREKIKLLYADILQREPTTAELSHYADSVLTINQIQDELSVQ